MRDAPNRPERPISIRGRPGVPPVLEASETVSVAGSVGSSLGTGGSVTGG